MKIRENLRVSHELVKCLAQRECEAKAVKAELTRALEKWVDRRVQSGFDKSWFLYSSHGLFLHAISLEGTLTRPTIASCTWCAQSSIRWLRTESSRLSWSIDSCIQYRCCCNCSLQTRTRRILFDLFISHTWSYLFESFSSCLYILNQYISIPHYTCP